MIYKISKRINFNSSLTAIAWLFWQCQVIFSSSVDIPGISRQKLTHTAPPPPPDPVRLTSPANYLLGISILSSQAISWYLSNTDALNMYRCHARARVWCVRACVCVCVCVCACVRARNVTDVTVCHVSVHGMHCYTCGESVMFRCVHVRAQRLWILNRKILHLQSP